MEVFEDPTTPGNPFLGAVCFREGFFYPMLTDEAGSEIGPNLEKPLIWVHDFNHHVYAAPTDPSHFHSYGLNVSEIVPEP